jgi:hypothetical protein
MEFFFNLPIIRRIVEITDDADGNITYRFQTKNRVLVDITIYRR